MHNAVSYTVHTKRLNIRRYNQGLCYIIIIKQYIYQTNFIVQWQSIRFWVGLFWIIFHLGPKSYQRLEFGLSKGNYAKSYVGRLRLTKQQIYLYHYWTWTEAQLKRRSSPRPCWSTMYRQLIIIIIYSNALLMLNCP